VRKIVAIVAVLAASAVPARAIINPNFTPKDLADQADLVMVGPLTAGGNAMLWTLTNAKTLKGQAGAKHVIDLSKCKKDHVNDIAAFLGKNGKAPVAFYFGTLQEVKRGVIHVGGQWLAVVQAGKDRWNVTGYAPEMSGTYAGATDMLIRMTEYLIKDPESYVPVHAGIRWAGDGIEVGKVGGRVGGMAAVSVGKAKPTHLYVASSAGDRLYRPKEADDEWSFTDVTAAAGLKAKSLRFCWLDVDGDGQADLISWDGKALSVLLVGKDGKFKPAAKPGPVKLASGCTNLAACSVNGKPALLASTHGQPVRLVLDAKGAWKQAALPGAAAKAQEISPAGASVAADLNADGFVDVLQIGQVGSLLWKGKAGGFNAPVKIGLASGSARITPAVGDFNEDGSPDLFIAGRQKNTLWENDGKAKFREVFRRSGSVSYKCQAGAIDVRATDLNHDGRIDLCLIYQSSDLLYHFNRGFRAFGEEGEVRLPGLRVETGQKPVGQKAMVVGDFNADGANDLAVVLTNHAKFEGRVVCYLNDQYEMPGLRLRLPAGVTGPVTASVWQTEEYPVCAGTAVVAGHAPAAYLCARYRGACVVKWRMPGGAAQSKTVKVGSAPVDVILAAPKPKPKPKAKAAKK